MTDNHTLMIVKNDGFYEPRVMINLVLRTGI